MKEVLKAVREYRRIEANPAKIDYHRLYIEKTGG